MKKINVIPLESINNIKFGLNREKVRDLMGDYKEFKKSKFSKNTSDDFGFCHVYYNLLNECEAFEFFGDEISIFIKDKQVYPSKISEIKHLFDDLKEDNGSLVSKSKSVGVYASGDNIESILFGVKDYYK